MCMRPLSLVGEAPHRSTRSNNRLPGDAGPCMLAAERLAQRPGTPDPCVVGPLGLAPGPRVITLYAHSCG
jgi:hypothetical protein